MRYTAEALKERPYYYGCRGMNEAVIDNIMGRELSYQLQPYAAGKGRIMAVQPRTITTTKRLPEEGTCTVTYEVFDLEVEVIEGHRFGGFYCGVPISKARNMAGQTEFMTLTRGDLQRCVFADNPSTYIHATCG